MQINIKTPQEILGIRKACQINADLFDELTHFIHEGQTTKEIDNFCRGFILSRGAKPAFLNFEGFSGSACISVNEAIIHGVPSKHFRIKDGDLVKVDLGVNLGGFFSDSARSFHIGNVPPEVQKLDKVCKECLDRGIEAASQKGARLYDIARAVFTHANENGFSVVKNYCGHGVGIAVHEEPEVNNYIDTRNQNLLLRPGWVIAIEPMITLGRADNHVLGDGWTVVTDDGECAAHQEDTIAVTESGVEILTRH